MPVTRPSRVHTAVAITQILLLLALAAPTAVVAANVTAPGLSDKDFRTGSVQPSAAQLSRVAQLGAKATWNRFGTPQSLIKYGGWLAKRVSGTPAVAARNWIRTNRTLFKLTDADVTNLELVADNTLRGTSGHAVLFRQRFGTLDAGQDGLIVVGIKGGKVAYASSSAAGSMAAPQGAILSAQQAWLAAATHVGRPVNAAALGSARQVSDWTVFSAEGLKTPQLADKSFVDQRARLVAVPTFSNGVRAAFETIVLDTSPAEPLAYTVFVDARTGDILMRYNRVDHAEHEHSRPQPAATNQAPTFGTFSGVTDQPNNCGPDHEIIAPMNTRTIDIVASATIAADDITIHLLNSAHVEIAANTETGTSPEFLHYETAPLPGPTTFYVRICQFTADVDPFTYEGSWATNDVVSTATDFQYPPKWLYFRAHPSLALDPSGDDPYDLTNSDTRLMGCWVTQHNGVNVPECSAAVGKLQNLAARAPWDHNVQPNTPSFTTIGNQAITGEAWVTPLTPGPFAARPVHTDRRYADHWSNMWNQSRCDPASLTLGNDIYAAVTNLFVAHNRMHDWSYFLGFTEDTWNLQENNFGNNPGLGQEHDPEFGQAQAGAALPVEAGVSRDNANQITLNDGVPGITNMYLWQPIAGGFYAPCVDGDYDMAVIGHEYGHAISNRMAGGPDAGLTGTHARAMGESWSDLMAMEYLNEYSLVPTNGESRYAVGAYATGNLQRGIRNYNMSTSPLNYSDVGYDFVCNAPLVSPDLEGVCPDGRTQVHADGEIWSATNFALREAFINRYGSSNPTRQKACADGVYPASSCPGNRRWIQIMFDAWLLMPASVTMLDARDQYLAADMMRFGGANQKLMWKVFAQRGMGINATATGQSTTDPSETDPTLNDPTPSFRSPLHPFKSVKFRIFAADEGNAPITNAKVYVGHFEAAATPVADTLAATPLSDTAQFVAGDYEFLVAAPGYGHLRFPRRINETAGSINVDVYMSTNVASLHKGAVATGTGTSVDNPVNNMFDDTELTNWVSPVPAASLVTVDLAGGVQNVKRVNVSAMLNPENGGRFRALRQFEIWTCNGDAVFCALPTNFTKIFTSAPDAFPGARPRPVAPDLILRSFDVPDTNATHVQLRVLSNQCTATDTGFRGDQDADLTNDTDCVTGSDADLDVKAAELQVFSSTPALPPQDPAVLVTVSAPATIATGSQMTYTISYTNAGPAASSNAKMTDVLPTGVQFVSASNGGTYNATNRTVKWNLGTINVGFTGQRTLVVQVTAPVGTVLTNSAKVVAPLTLSVSPPAVTVVTP